LTKSPGVYPDDDHSTKLTSTTRTAANKTVAYLFLSVHRVSERSIYGY